MLALLMGGGGYHIQSWMGEGGTPSSWDGDTPHPRSGQGGVPHPILDRRGIPSSLEWGHPISGLDGGVSHFADRGVPPSPDLGWCQTVKVMATRP